MNRLNRAGLRPYFILCIIALGAIEFGGCSRNPTPTSLTAAQSAAITADVREFAHRVADDVTQRGPIAWQTHFANRSEFFMAVDGQLAFADSASANHAIQQLTVTLPHVELSWQEPVRVDPLTPNLAMVAASYHEIQIDNTGKRVEENGFFTGLAELGPEGWKFRDAHWSDPTAPAKPPDRQ